MTNVVRFLCRARVDLGGVLEVMPEIDGVELTDFIHRFEIERGMETRSSSYGGLVPSYYNFGRSTSTCSAPRPRRWTASRPSWGVRAASGVVGRC